jgi:hypothetical protein
MEVSIKICKGPLCNGGTEKPITEFSPTLRICKACNTHNTKEYYKLNDRPYRKYKNEIKANSKCADCGCDDIRVLDFDHLGTKTINICKSFSKEEIKNELQYTQVLCIWCHRLKTRKDIELQMEKTAEQYSITDRPISKEEGKSCIGPLCNGQLQYLNKFPISKKTYCKPCISYKARRIREKNYEFLTNLKLDHKQCELCNIQVTEENVTCFDFDHLRDKSINISNLVRKNFNTIAKILEESEKCRLLCCKCHRIHTSSQLNYKYNQNILDNTVE